MGDSSDFEFRVSKKNVRIAAVVVLVIAAFVGAFFLGRNLSPSSPGAPRDGNDPTASGTSTSSAENPEEETAAVVSVTDGDTIQVRLLNGRREAVRYIGINTPELDQPYGQEARSANEGLVAGKQVKLVKDVSERDQYNRLLRYVYVGDLFINAELLKRGFAQVATYPPDVRYTDDFLSLQRQARSARAGLWASSPQAGEAAAGIPWNEASGHVGETITVYGPVVGANYASSSDDKPTFLNLGADYPDSGRFTIVIRDRYRGNFPSAPESYYPGKTIAVAGLVSLYNGAAQIEVTSPDEIEIR
jgi:micrococcal nuclease